MPKVGLSPYGRKYHNQGCARSLGKGYYNLPKISMVPISNTKQCCNLSKPLWAVAKENNFDMGNAVSGYDIRLGGAKISAGAASAKQVEERRLYNFKHFKVQSIEVYGKPVYAVPNWDDNRNEPYQREMINYFLRTSRSARQYYHALQYGVQSFTANSTSPYYIDSKLDNQNLMDMMIRNTGKFFWDNYHGKRHLMEVLNENLHGDSISDPPTRGYGQGRLGMYHTPWYDQIKEYYDRYHAAYPKVGTLLNDACIPGLPPTQTTYGKVKLMGNFKNLVKRLTELGMQIEYIGFQCHFSEYDQVSEAQVKIDFDYFAQYCTKGLYITELDCGYYGNTLTVKQKHDNVAEKYRQYLQWMLSHEAVVGCTTWTCDSGSNWRASVSGQVDQSYCIVPFVPESTLNSTALKQREASTSNSRMVKTSIFYSIQDALKRGKRISYKRAVINA
jgi:GH35 family endo-1,4-beta-xylanase